LPKDAGKGWVRPHALPIPGLLAREGEDGGGEKESEEDGRRG
jgi:hypothetical protein